MINFSTFYFCCYDEYVCGLKQILIRQTNLRLYYLQHYILRNSLMLQKCCHTVSVRWARGTQIDWHTAAVSRVSPVSLICPAAQITFSFRICYLWTSRRVYIPVNSSRVLDGGGAKTWQFRGSAPNELRSASMLDPHELTHSTRVFSVA